MCQGVESAAALTGTFSAMSVGSQEPQLPPGGRFTAGASVVGRFPARTARILCFSMCEVMMFGMTGSGKSALGNLLAGYDHFVSGDDTATWWTFKENFTEASEASGFRPNPLCCMKLRPQWQTINRFSSTRHLIGLWSCHLACSCQSRNGLAGEAQKDLFETNLSSSPGWTPLV